MATKRKTSFADEMKSLLEKDIQSGKLTPANKTASTTTSTTLRGNSAQGSAAKSTGSQTAAQYTKAQSATATGSMTEEQLKNPFKSDALNFKYHQTVKQAHKYGSEDPLEDAYTLVSQYRDNVKASYAAGGEDPLEAAEQIYSKSLKELERNTSVKGLNYEQLMDKLHSMGGYLTDSEWAKANLGTTQKEYLGVASGDLDAQGVAKSTLQGAKERSEQQEILNRLPEFIATIDAGQGLDMSNEDIGKWQTFLNSDEGSAWYDSINGMSQAERQQAAQTYAQEHLAQLAKDTQLTSNAAAYDAREESDDVKWLKEYIRKNTTQGAQEWLDDVTGTAEEQAAKDALYFAGYKEKTNANRLAEDYATASIADQTNTKDRLYAYINNIGNTRSQSDKLTARYNLTDYTPFTYITDEEAKDYNYIYATEGAEAAREYAANYLKYTLDERKAGHVNEELRELGADGVGGGILASVGSLPLQMISGVGAADLGLQNLRNAVTGEYKPINYNTNAAQLGQNAGSLREGVQEQVDWNINLFGHDIDLFDMLYSTGMSTIDSVLGAKLGSTLNTIRYTTAAGQEAAMKAHENGASDTQALWSMAAGGLAEWLGEAVPFDKMFKMADSTDVKTLSSVIKNVLKEGATNAPGEMLTEFANMFAEQLIMGENSDAAQAYQQYLDLGLSKEEATKRIAAELGWQIAEAGFGGFLQGAGMGAAAEAQGARQNAQLDKLSGQNIISQQTGGNLKALAMAFGADTEVGKAGAKFNPATATAKETGRLYRQILNEMPGEGDKSKVRGAVAEGVANTLQELGETGDTESKADTILRVYAGEAVTTAQWMELAGSEHGLEILNALSAPEALNRQGQAAAKTAWRAEKKAEITEAEADRQAAQEAQTVEKSLRQTEEQAQLMRDLVVPSEQTKNIRPGTAAEAESWMDADADMAQETATAAQESTQTGEADTTTQEVAQAGGTAQTAPEAEKTATNAQEAQQTAKENKQGSGNVTAIRMGDDGAQAVTADGKTMPADEANLTDTQKKLLTASEGLDSEAAASMQREYQEGEDAQDYARGYQQVYEAAKQGKTLEQAGSLFADTLTDAQRKSAWQAGQKAAAQERQNAAQKNRSLATAYGFSALEDAQSTKAGLYFANVTKNIKNIAQTQLQLIDQFARQNGFQVRVYDSLKNGSANGQLRRGTNIINLALDAQDGALTRTVSHEVYHFVQQWSQEQGTQLKNFILEKLESLDEYDTLARIQEKQEEYQQNGVELTANEAAEELCADSVLDVIGTEENIRSLIRQDKGLARKVGQIVRQLADKLRSILQRFGSRSPEVAKLSEDAAYTETVAQQMEDALSEAMENYKMATEGQFAAAKQDAAVQAYIQAMETATTEAQAQEAMNELLSDLFNRSQQHYMEQNPDADLDTEIKRFAMALQAFGDGRTGVQAALKRSGFDAPQDGDALIAPLAYAGKKLTAMEARGMEAEPQLSFKGVDEETGKKIYKADFYEGLTKQEKQKKLAELIQNVWANKPITLPIEEDGETREIEARFNPDFDPTNERKTDVGKMVYGNHMGNATEKRLTLDLSGDMYQIISDTGFDANKKEQGKQTDTHKGVKQWKYFATDILVEGAKGKEPYTVHINVKEKADGNYVYTYYVLNEKKSAKLRSLSATVPSLQTEGDYDVKIEANSVDGIIILGNEETVKPQKNSLKNQNITDQVGQDAALASQMKSDKDIKAAAELMQKLHRTVRAGDGYMTQGENAPVLRAGEWNNRVSTIAKKAAQETGTKMSTQAIAQSLRALYNGMDKTDVNLGDALMFARSLGRQMLEQSPGVVVEQDEGTKEVVRIVKSNRFYLTDDMKSEIRGTYGSLKAFMQKNFGKMAIRSNESAKVSLAEVWAESLNPLMPGTFAADVTEADMPIILDAFLETAGQKKFAGEYGANIEQYATDVGLSLMLEYYDVPGGIGKAEGLRNELIKARDNLEKTYAARYKERLTSQAKRRDEYQRRDVLRRQIDRDSKYLAIRVNNPTDNRHVPAGLEEVSRALSTAIRASQQFDEDALLRLKDAYQELGKDGNEYDIAHAYDDDIMLAIEDMMKTLPGKKLTDLDNEQLQALANVTGNLHKMIAEGNEIIINGRKQTIEQAGESMLAELGEKQDVKREHLKNAAMHNTTPVYFAEQLGGAVLKIYNDMLEGQNKYAFRMRDGQKAVSAAVEKYKVNEWLYKKDDVLRFTTAQGRDIELTRDEALSLYATYKREKSDNRQHAEHLSTGGIIFGAESQKLKKKARSNRAREKAGKKLSSLFHPARITDLDMQTVQQWLTKEQMAFADEMVNYISTDISAWGNETSRSIYGYDKFTESYYFPYKTSKDYISRDMGKGDGSQSRQPKNMGMSKRTARGARNPIVIDGFMETIASHINDMAIYSCFSESVDNMNRLFNYQSEVTQDGYGLSVKAEIKRVYGSYAEEYMAHLIQDVGGGVAAQERVGFLDKGLSKFKANAVAANASVVIQQPSAIMRSMAMINPKYFVPVNHANAIKEAKEMEQYSGVGIIKSMGRFDTGTGMTGTEWLLDDVKKQSAKARFDDKVGDLTGWGAEQADRVTWGAMWAAVKREVSATSTLEYGSTEYFDAVAKRFNDVMNHTQVYDSILVKSDIMRDKSVAAKMATAFMAEPTVSYNLLQNAIINAGKVDSSGKHIGRKYLARATAAWMANTLFNAMLQSLVTLGRRKEDEDLTLIEKYLAELAENFTDALNPLSIIPIARDIVSIFQGYTAERSDLSTVQDVKDAYDVVMDSEASLTEKVLSVIGAAGNVVGIPAKNVIRDVQGLIRTVQTPFAGTSGRDIGYSMLEGLSILGFGVYDGSRKAYYGRLTDALVEGDEEKEEKLRGYLTETKKIEVKTMNSGVRYQLEDLAEAGKLTWDKYFTLWKASLGGQKSNIRSAILSMFEDGRLSEAEATKLLKAHGEYKTDDDVYYAIEKSKWQTANEDSGEDYTRYWKVYEAVKAGKSADAAIKEMTQHGYTEKAVRSQIQQRIGDWYTNGEMTRAAAEKALKTYTDKTDPDDIWFQIRRWDHAGEDDYSAYGDFLTAVKTGTNLSAKIKELTDHGVSQSTLSGKITAQYKEEYIKLYQTNKTAAAELKARLLTGYAALGYNRNMKSRDIDKWVTNAAKTKASK